jgi:hypothetical protein
LFFALKGQVKNNLMNRHKKKEQRLTTTLLHI